MPAAPPNPASTVVLLREAQPGAPPEVLLLQRRRSASWLGGAWVFPGGRVDDGDREPAWDDLCLGTAELHAAWPDADAAWLRDHAVAAVREVFEETAVLLADTVTPQGADRPPEFTAAVARPDDRRHLLDGLVSFAGLCARRHWRLHLDRLVPFIRWITPEQERRRFDTVFFLATAPAAELHMHEQEMDAHAWMTAAAAVDRFHRGDLEVSPPTLRTLEDLATVATVEAALAWARTVPRRVIAPRFHQDADGQWLLLPGDPAYPPTTALPVPPPTRFVLRDGRWQSAR